MDRLIIIGAGNVGGYIAYNIEDFGPYKILGFLDDDVSKIGKALYGHPVLGSVDTIDRFASEKDVHVVIGISSPVARAEIAKKVQQYPFVFPNFIAKSAWLSRHVRLGQGIILYPGVSINYETSVQDFVIVNMNCAIGHNCTIESCVSLAPGVNLGGFTYIEHGASMGIGASTRQNVRVGKYATVGGQAMLLRDVSANDLVMGVPARVKK